MNSVDINLLKFIGPEFNTLGAILRDPVVITYGLLLLVVLIYIFRYSLDKNWKMTCTNYIGSSSLFFTLFIIISFLFIYLHQTYTNIPNWIGFQNPMYMLFTILLGAMTLYAIYRIRFIRGTWSLFFLWLLIMFFYTVSLIPVYSFFGFSSEPFSEISLFTIGTFFSISFVALYKPEWITLDRIWIPIVFSLGVISVGQYLHSSYFMKEDVYGFRRIPQVSVLNSIDNQSWKPILLLFTHYLTLFCVTIYYWIVMSVRTSCNKATINYFSESFAMFHSAFEWLEKKYFY
jgi:hypothetical protein